MDVRGEPWVRHGLPGAVDHGERGFVPESEQSGPCPFIVIIFYFYVSIH